MDFVLYDMCAAHFLQLFFLFCWLLAAAATNEIKPLASAT